MHMDENTRTYSGYTDSGRSAEDLRLRLVGMGFSCVELHNLSRDRVVDFRPFHPVIMTSECRDQDGSRMHAVQPQAPKGVDPHIFRDLCIDHSKWLVVELYAYH